MQKIKEFCYLFSVICFLSSVVHTETADIVIDAGSQLGNISPYVYGHNTSGVYYKAPMTNPVMLGKIAHLG